jgi:LacI family transcriptional regulator
MATIYEVSELAGVSLATVSRVLNNSDRVRETTRLKVQEAMRSLDYRPNSNAQSLASNRSNCVGILVPELHGPFFGTMLSGIESELRTANKHAIITVGHSDATKEREGIEFLATRNVDAQILVVDAVSDAYLQQLSTGNTPIVVINRQVATLEDRCISLDNEQGGYMAARAAIDMGHKTIAYISGPQWKNDARDRLNGHKRALHEAGIAFNEALTVAGDFRETGGKAGMHMLLKLKPKQPFSVVICANDEMAAAAMEVATDSGLTLPGDLSIIGFDNVNFCRYMHPKLSTVEQPVNEIGIMAARWVLKHVYKDESVVIQNIFLPTFLQRGSMIHLDA